MSELDDAELWDQSTTGTELERAEACRELAQRKLNRREFSDALAMAQQGYDFYRILSDDAGQAECLFYAGRAEQGQKHYAEALDFFQQSAQLHSTNVNENYLANIVNVQGDCYKELGQFELARQKYENSAKLYANGDNAWWASIGGVEAAEMHLKVHDWDGAELAAAKSIEFAVEAENNNAMARALLVRATAYKEQGNYDAAVEAMGEARAVSKYSDNQNIRHNVLREHALLLAERGDSPALQGSLSEFREITAARNDAECLAMADYIEALAAFNDFEMEKAQALLRNATVMLSYTKEKEWAFLALELEARIHFFTEDFIQAAVGYDKAADFAAKHSVFIDGPGFFMHRAQVLINLNRAESALEVLDAMPEQELVSPLDNAVLDEIRSRALLKCYRPLDALKLAEAAAAVLEEYDPRSFLLGKVLETKGHALLQLGGQADATEPLIRAMQIHSVNDNTDEAKAVADLLLGLKNVPQKLDPANTEPELPGV